MSLLLLVVVVYLFCACSRYYGSPNPKRHLKLGVSALLILMAKAAVVGLAGKVLLVVHVLVLNCID